MGEYKAVLKIFMNNPDLLESSAVPSTKNG